MKYVLFILTLSFSTIYALQVQGVAVHANTPAYTEMRTYDTHQSIDFTSKYLDHNNALFATKEAIFRDSRWQPEIRLNDIRQKIELSVTIVNKIVSTLFIFQNDTTRYSRSVSKDLVWDAGMHYWIIDNWDSLATQKQLQLFVPEKNTVLTMTAKRVHNGSYHIITITPGSFLVRLFLDPITIKYSNEKEIVHYHGISDIKSIEGDNYTVKISYQTFEEE